MESKGQISNLLIFHLPQDLKTNSNLLILVVFQLSVFSKTLVILILNVCVQIAGYHYTSDHKLGQHILM